MSKPAPSAGALRAAVRLFPKGKYNWVHGTPASNALGIKGDQEHIARLIDEEMAADLAAFRRECVCQAPQGGTAG